MIKKINYFLILFILATSSAYSNNNIFISVTVNDQIITNFDIEKESEYLKILNPKLSNLEKKVDNIAKDSLINEIVKKSEIQQRLNINKENAFVEEHLKKLYTNLNFKNVKEFKKFS